LKGVGDPNRRRSFGPSFGALICAPGLPVILPGYLKKYCFFCKLFQTINKRGRRPQPLHGQTDAVLSGTISKKIVFLASFFKPLIKGFLAAGGKSWRRILGELVH